MIKINFDKLNFKKETKEQYLNRLELHLYEVNQMKEACENAIKKYEEKIKKVKEQNND